MVVFLTIFAGPAAQHHEVDAKLGLLDASALVGVLNAASYLDIAQLTEASIRRVVSLLERAYLSIALLSL